MTEMRAEFLGLEFDRLDQTQTLEKTKQLARGESFSCVVTPNVDHMVRLHEKGADDRLWQIYREAELCVCDSQILRSLAGASGIDLPLVTGSDLTARLVGDLNGEGATIAIVGGDEELFGKLQRLYPSIDWRQNIPPMGVARNIALQEQIADFVEKTGAGIVLFAIGSPQSEMVCDLIKKRQIAKGVGLCIGASLEFMVGAKSRAPEWMQRFKLEWLFRLLSEPTRLWRRYLVHGPRIFAIWKNWQKAKA